MKERKKRSVIWNIMSNEEFTKMVKNSKSYGEMLKHFGLVNKGGNQTTLRHRILNLNIDDSHIKRGVNSNLGRIFFRKKTPLEKIFVKNSSYCRCDLKKRIIEESLIANECSMCGQKPFWNNKRLTLVLDHINGIYNDNRLKNLRFVCPNCHSQTPTFAGRNATKCIHPTKEILEELMKKISMVSIGKQYGVTSGAVRKWAIRYGILKKEINGCPNRI